jgi:magnesium transporter
MRYNSNGLETIEVYFFLGENWLITIHSSQINLLDFLPIIFKDGKCKLNNEFADVTAEYIYQKIISETINQYKQVLNFIEVTMINKERQYLQKKITTEILDYLYFKIIQLINLRTCFWNVRKILNVLTQLKQGAERERYAVMYKDIDHLIKCVELLKNNINPKRHLYARVYHFKK